MFKWTFSDALIIRASTVVLKNIITGYKKKVI